MEESWEILISLYTSPTIFRLVSFSEWLSYNDNISPGLEPAQDTNLVDTPLNVFTPGSSQTGEHLLGIAGPQALPDLPELVQFGPLGPLQH